MHGAVEAFATGLASEHAWMLGRFVVPVSRLAEFADAAVARGGPARWPLSVLAGDDPDADARTVEQLLASHRDHIDVESIECRAWDTNEIDRWLTVFPTHVVFVEVPLREGLSDVLGRIAARGGRAKIRTGGVTADLFPTVAQVADFIACCAVLGLGFKATAGLHHPLRAEHALTYERDSHRALMHGFLNVFLAAADAFVGATAEEIAITLELHEAGVIRFHGDHVTAGTRQLPLEALGQARERLVTSFGSCSFRDPVEDLRTLGFL